LAVSDGQRTWLRSEQGCFVTEYDTVPYRRSCETVPPAVDKSDVAADVNDLRPCDQVPERVQSRNYVVQSSVACRICPNSRSVRPKATAALTGAQMRSGQDIPRGQFHGANLFRLDNLRPVYGLLSKGRPMAVSLL
jgi:hypothetical protein